MVTSILVYLFIIEQDTIGETKENNKWHSTQKPRTAQNSPIDCDGVQLHQYWTTQVSVLILRPAINMKDKMCQRHASNQTPTPSCSSPKLKSQSIHV